MSKAKVPKLNLPFLVSYVLVIYYYYIYILYPSIWFSNELFKRLKHCFQSSRRIRRNISELEAKQKHKHALTYTHTHTHTHTCTYNMLYRLYIIYVYGVKYRKEKKNQK